MTTFLYVILIIAAVVLLVPLMWRIASRRFSVPCPSTFAWLVERDNPFARTTGADAIVGHLGLRSGMKVLDVGCGPGRVAIPVARAVGPEGEVTAMDVQPGMIRKIEIRVGRERVRNIRCVLAGVGTGALERNHYDRALLVTVLGEVPDRKAALKEIYESLKPGGILSITEMMLDPHYQRRDTVLTLGREAGFREHGFFGGRFAFTQNLEKPSAG